MYHALVVDTVNLGYQVASKENQSGAVKYEGKKVYRKFIEDFMTALQFLASKYLEPGGQIFLLYDNYHSRAELAKMLRPLKITESRKKVNKDYKAGRKGAKIEFYNALDLIRTWAFIAPPQYRTARIPGLEADDLVKPCLAFIRERNPDARVLLVTNDSDWCRYLSDTVQYLPEHQGAPKGIEDFRNRFGFLPSEEKVILYKILEGDAADHVNMVFPFIPPEDRQAILDTWNTTVDFLFEVHGDPRFARYSQGIKNGEIDAKIAYQVLSAKEVGLPHFKRIVTQGRNFLPLQNRWNQIFSSPVAEEPQQFAFGGLRVPRKDPKPEEK